jgi:hypothetical protein
VRLTLIGYWLGENEPGWPDVRRFVDSSWSVDEREAVADWLDSGVKIRFFLGASTCRFCGRANGSSEASDGEFLWPDGLGHYVREHDVRLPSSVVERATQRPTIDRSRLEGAEERDEDFLIEVEWWRHQRPDWT